VWPAPAVGVGEASPRPPVPSTAGAFLLPLRDLTRSVAPAWTVESTNTSVACDSITIVNVEKSIALSGSSCVGAPSDLISVSAPSVSITNAETNVEKVCVPFDSTPVSAPSVSISIVEIVSASAPPDAISISNVEIACAGAPSAAVSITNDETSSAPDEIICLIK